MTIALSSLSNKFFVSLALFLSMLWMSPSNLLGLNHMQWYLDLGLGIVIKVR